MFPTMLIFPCSALAPLAFLVLTLNNTSPSPLSLLLWGLYKPLVEWGLNHLHWYSPSPAPSSLFIWNKLWSPFKSNSLSKHHQSFPLDYLLSASPGTRPYPAILALSPRRDSTQTQLNTLSCPNPHLQLARPPKHITVCTSWSEP